jgi:transposase
MNKALPTSAEPLEDLQKQLRAERNAKRRQRLQALYLLASGQATSRVALAQLLAVHRHTIRAWLTLYAAGGLPALLTLKPAPGKTPALSPAALRQLRARLDDPRGFASYGEVQQYLAREHHVHRSYSAVRALVRYQLQAKPKAPRRSHPKKSRQKSRTSSRRSARSS